MKKNFFKIVWILLVTFLFIPKINAEVTLNDVATSLGSLPYIIQLKGQTDYFDEINITVLENDAGLRLEIVPGIDSPMTETITMDFLKSSTNSNVLIYTTVLTDDLFYIEFTMMTQMVIAVGLANDIDYDDVVATMNDDTFFTKATLEKDNIELIENKVNNEMVSTTLNIVYNEKYSIIDSTSTYVTYDDLNKFNEGRDYNSIQMTRGYVTLHIDGNQESDEIVINISESKNFTFNTYNTMVDTLKFIFKNNTNINNYFSTNYPSLNNIPIINFTGAKIERNPVKNSFETYIFGDEETYRIALNVEEFTAAANGTVVGSLNQNESNTDTSNEIDANPKTRVEDFGTIILLMLVTFSVGYYFLRKRNVINQF